MPIGILKKHFLGAFLLCLPRSQSVHFKYIANNEL